jgi:hypothetical protein
MKKVCFVVSHLGSGSSELVESLNRNPRCEIHSTRVQYSSPDSLNWMFSRGHKMRNSSAVYGDHLLFNASLSCRKLYEFCKFIYVIRPARQSLEGIMSSGYGEEEASRYYRFRLRRICEMAKRTPSAVIATWDDLARGEVLKSIESYVGLSSPLEGLNLSEGTPCAMKESAVEQCQDAYERYHYFLKSLKEVRI